MKDCKIGYTTGVFDMFHIGHLNILRRAKEQCDYLIVGVSTDALVLQEKDKVPVIPYEERAAIVGAIKYVDQVVPQINKDKFAAWERHHFDKMFVGSDWQGSKQWEQYEKALEFSVVRFAGRVMLERLSQLLKALPLISVTESGMVTEVRASQPWKMELGSTVIPSGITISVRLLQEEKLEPPRDWRVEGKETEVTLEQLLKA